MPISSTTIDATLELKCNCRDPRCTFTMSINLKDSILIDWLQGDNSRLDAVRALMNNEEQYTDMRAAILELIRRELDDYEMLHGHTPPEGVPSE